MDTQHEGSEFIRHEPCPSCGSRNNLGRYTDGHAHCFGCGYRERGDGKTTPASDGTALSSFEAEGSEKPQDVLSLHGEVIDLPARMLREETCRVWQYRYGNVSGKPAHIAFYLNASRQPIAAKVRFGDKTFKWIGDPKAIGLYGQWLWPKGGKKIVVTEGEIDALTLSQLQDNKWPVVSITHGAQGAVKCVKKEIEYLSSFDSVIFMFDMDEPGQKAAQECAALFTPGKAKLASLPYKDANECLLKGKGEDVIRAMWNAKGFRPDGIRQISDIREKILASPEQGLPWWDERLTKLTYGRRYTETYAFGAGTGVGKTDWFTEQMKYDMTVLEQDVGVFALEQPTEETAKRIAGKFAGRRFHVPDGSWTQEELVATIDKLETDNRLFLYDSFGATDWAVIASTIRFLAHAEGVKLFYLDHLTALAAKEEDDLKALKVIMAEMAALAKELKVIIHFISHLSRPKEGKSHEEGGRVMIRNFYGASAIGFWSHFMFGLERDQQSDDVEEQNRTTFRCLKDRYTGQGTGKTIHYNYDHAEGRLVPCEAPPPKEDKRPTFQNKDF